MNRKTKLPTFNQFISENRHFGPDSFHSGFKSYFEMNVGTDYGSFEYKSEKDLAFDLDIRVDAVKKMVDYLLELVDSNKAVKSKEARVIALNYLADLDEDSLDRLIDKAYFSDIKL
jgi:hypothetical protein